MTNKEFIDYLKELNITPTENQLKQLNTYYEFLNEYNKTTNLTRITEESEVYLKHFYDSLTIVKEIDLNSINNLLDIGTGAGFPGVILKIFYPHLEVTLLDSNNKKTKFLELLITRLELENIFVVNKRAEEYAQIKKESFDLVTSRAVANLITLAEFSIPFVKIEGHFIALKGDLEKEEDATYAIEVLGGIKINNNCFKLPIENSTRNIIKIKKTKTTPDGYPRIYDKIIKKPLKK